MVCQGFSVLGFVHVGASLKEGVGVVRCIGCFVIWGLPRVYGLKLVGIFRGFGFTGFERVEALGSRGVVGEGVRGGL